MHGRKGSADRSTETGLPYRKGQPAAVTARPVSTFTRFAR